MERLQRQLMEFEVMESMYPGDDDLTTGSFVVQNPEGVEAVRALVDAWEASGTEPAVEALDALAPLRGSLTLAVPDGAGNANCAASQASISPSGVGV